MDKQQLSESFLNDYKQMCSQYDKLEQETLFNGAQMEQLINKFLGKHESYMQIVCNYPADVTSLLKHTLNNSTSNSNNKCTWSESLEDDLSLLQGCKCVVAAAAAQDLKTEKIKETSTASDNTAAAAAVDSGKQKSRSNSITLSPADTQLTPTSEPSELLADVYRRACEACYLRVTISKARLKREDDRREPVKLGQRAIRYNPNNFKACYWYMIACGWCLDGASVILNPRERTLAGETFKRAIMRCLELEPRDPLSHHLMGRYYYHVAGLTWLHRSVARNFLNTQVEGTYEDAERELKLAHELRDDWLPTGLWLARVLLEQGGSGKRQEADCWIKWALKMEAREPTTEIERDELLELAKKLKVVSANN